MEQCDRQPQYDPAPRSSRHAAKQQRRAPDRRGHDPAHGHLGAGDGSIVESLPEKDGVQENERGNHEQQRHR
jgi:hypothetical protein